MHLKLFTPKQALNKAYLKEKISRTDIELFKKHFVDLIEKINDKGDEEHLKSLIADFLKLTYYNNSQHQINPIGKNDLVIHTGKSPSDPYGVILEVKSPTNTGEMISKEKANVKAIHELILYYLEERIAHNRNELKQLIVTNIYDWYIIDANEFDKKIYRNTTIKKLYELKKSDNKDNPWFYDELKKIFNANTDFSIDATFFDLRDYKKIITNKNREDDKGLISLYKILSPVHLLKLPFANDSNTLQPKFYSELLHLIGLHEYKEGSKKLINRKKEGERNKGSLLENTIIQLDSHDKISRLDKPSQYGDNYQDRLYNVALELVITWINRILFLKLLEAQLINYHKGDRSYTFLTKDKLHDFDDLDKLFFRVLAKRTIERDGDIQKLFGKVPYLNSSLFEPTDLEHQTLFISGLENAVSLPVIGSTVLKNDKSKILKGELETLDYLFSFLSAYDFSSEGAEEIQEDNKQLINASVLGLIFEKINGYKDGSFFTPGFITMYMCRETIRRAVIQKFNETKNWDCKDYQDLYDKTIDKQEANTIVNSLKICDPAVGSGHFLVSALNELIAIKSDLRILTDRDGRSMHHYGVEVVNDELIITDEDGDIFEYNPNSKESQRVQETLFHEKQTIIENCLFGVDINPNSVKICRLRLWIELLKNAYYRADTKELETLPNIDINIKVGNSLISRFGLDSDLKQALKKSKFSIDSYKIAVQTYREASNKEEKREMERLIAAIKSDFRTEINKNDPKLIKLNRLTGELYNLVNQRQLFGENKTEIKERKKRQGRLENEVELLSTEVSEIKSNKIYENAFEWRFEFPEILNDDGDFVGFDIIIGNPPYGIKFSPSEVNVLKEHYLSFEYQANSYVLFFERGLSILKNEGLIDYITPATFTYQNYFKKIRSIFKGNHVLRARKFLYEVFEDADIGDSVLLLVKKSTRQNESIVNIHFSYLKEDVFDSLSIDRFYLNDDVFNLTDSEIDLRNIYNNTVGLGAISNIIVGIKPYQVGKGNPKQTREIVSSKIFTSTHKVDNSYLSCINGF
jgi:adenine-specific DNA-methyltransferase